MLANTINSLAETPGRLGNALGSARTARPWRAKGLRTCGGDPSTIAVLAASYTAADLGYHGAAQLIRDEQLGPQAIARLFTYGLARDCGRVCALVLLAGATARHHACPEDWNGDVERELAEQALRPRSVSLWQGGRPAQAADQAAFAKLAKEAAAIVVRHWHEIAAA